jgi:hypothetical protein
MTAEGELTGELFGGRMEIRNVTVERPFGEGREIGADVEADRIDLERLTAALGAGRVTGRLSASVSGCGRLRPAGGVPSQGGVGPRERSGPVGEHQGGELHLAGRHGLVVERDGGLPDDVDFPGIRLREDRRRMHPEQRRLHSPGLIRKMV